MMYLDIPRTIFLVSQQQWIGFQVSKHHYARALAVMGHRVFFIDPRVTTAGFGRIEINETGVPNLCHVAYSGQLFRWLRFRMRWLYDGLCPFKVRQIIHKLGIQPDIVWDFDSHFQFRSLKLFDPTLKIFHPVDSLLPGWTATKDQDIHFALAPQFTEGIDPERIPTLFVPHGLNPVHAAYARAVVASPERFRAGRVRPVVGYVGNLSAHGIDWPMIERLVNENPAVSFRLIGPSKGLAESPYGPIIDRLRAAPNCELPGLMSAEDMVRQSHEIDLWLVCYDIARQPDAGINAHKVLEYLATGKAVLSNYIAAYEGTGLLHMPATRSNDNMPAILAQVLADPEQTNTRPEMIRRAEFALAHSYGANLDLINRFLSDWVATRSDAPANTEADRCGRPRC